MMAHAEQPDGRNPVGPNCRDPNGGQSCQGWSSQGRPNDGMPDNELLSAYIDGELKDEQLASVQLRLEKDAAARQLVAELRELSQAVRSLPRQRLDEEIRHSVLRRAEREMLIGDALSSSQEHADRVTRPPETSRAGPRRWIWAAMAMAAAVMLMFLQPPEENLPPRIAQAPPGKRPSMGPLAKSAAIPSTAPSQQSFVPAEEKTGESLTANSPVRDSRTTLKRPAAPAGRPVDGMAAENRVADGGRAGGAADQLSDRTPQAESNATPDDDRSVVMVHVTFSRHTRTASIDKFDTWLSQNQIQYAPSSGTRMRAKQDSKERLRQPLPPIQPKSEPGASARRIAMEQIAVEAPPHQLNGLLHACRNETNVETTVQSIRPEDPDLWPWDSRRLGRNRFSDDGTDEKNSLDSDSAMEAEERTDARTDTESKRASSFLGKTREGQGRQVFAEKYLPVGRATQLPTGPAQIDPLRLQAGRDLGRRFDFGLQSEERQERGNEKSGRPAHDQATAPPVQALFVLQWDEEEKGKERGARSKEAKGE